MLTVMHHILVLLLENNNTLLDVAFKRGNLFEFQGQRVKSPANNYYKLYIDIYLLIQLLNSILIEYYIGNA